MAVNPFQPSRLSTPKSHYREMLHSIPRKLATRHFVASRFSSTSSPSLSSAREFKVVLDNQTLYFEKPLAEALGWTHQSGVEGVKLTLHGWDPKFFAITPSGADSGKAYPNGICKLRNRRCCVLRAACARNSKERTRFQCSDCS